MRKLVINGLLLAVAISFAAGTLPGAHAANDAPAIGIEDLIFHHSRWVKRVVNVQNVRCYAASARDIRCVGNMAGAVVAIDSVAVSNPRGPLTELCGTLAKMLRSKDCLFTASMPVPNPTERVDDDGTKTKVFTPIALTLTHQTELIR